MIYKTKFQKIYPFAFYLLFLIVIAFLAPVTVAFAQGETPTEPVPFFQLTAFTLGSILSTIATLALDYAPGLAERFDKLTVAQKRGGAVIMAVLIVGTVFGLTCTHVISSNLTCSYTGAWDALSNVIWVFVIGQGIHAGTQPTPKFKREVLDIDPKSKSG